MGIRPLSWINDYTVLILVISAVVLFAALTVARYLGKLYQVRVSTD